MIQVLLENGKEKIISHFKLTEESQCKPLTQIHLQVFVYVENRMRS